MVSRLRRSLGTLWGAIRTTTADPHGRRATGTTLGAFLFLAGAATLERLDGAVAQMHPPDGVGGGIGAVASPAALIRADHALDITRGWAAWAGPGVVGRTADTTIGVYVAVDLLFAVLVAGILLLLVDRALATTGAAQSQAIHSMLNGSRATVAVYLGADWLETVVLGLQWRGATTGQMYLIGAFSLVKWVALALVLLGVAIASLHRVAPAASTAGAATVDPPPLGVRRSLVALRGQVVVLAALVVVMIGMSGNVGRQIDDVVIRTFEQFGRGLLCAVATLVFSAVLWLGCRHTLAAYADGGPTPSGISPTALRTLLLGGAAALGVGAWLLVRSGSVAWAWSAAPLVVIGAGMLLYVLLNVPRGVRAGLALTPSENPPRSSTAVPYIAAAAPLALALAITRAVVRLWVDGGSPWYLLAWIVGLVVAALVIAGVLAARPAMSAPSAPDQPPAPGRTAVTWSAAALVAGVVAFVWGPDVAANAGTVTVLVVGLATMTAIVTALVLVGDLWGVSGALTLLHLRRMPTLTLVLVIGVGASVVDREAVYYDARLLEEHGVQRVALTPPSGGSPASGDCDDTSALSALEQWLCAQPRGTAGKPSTVPLVLVSASGGGIRAAYWTSLALECLYGAALPYADLAKTCPERLDPRSVFMVSSVSGSSAGLAMVRAHAVGEDVSATWLDDVFGHDYLAPAMAAAVFRDLPNSVLRLPLRGWDRSSALEVGWQQGSPGLVKGFARTAYDGGAVRFPLLSFNGTSVNDGCRVVVSVVEGLEAGANPAGDCVTPSLFTRPGQPDRVPDGVLAATKDGFAWTCERDGRAPRTARDLRLSTAAMLSARFPYVSPAAGLNSCTGGSHTYVLDGGMVDNSGADTLVEVWRKLAPAVAANNTAEAAEVCVVPRLIMLDSGFAGVGAATQDSRTLQALAPGVGALGAYDNRSSTAQQEAMIELRRAVDEVGAMCPGADREHSVAHLFPLARPGVQAPLGWTLADQSQEVMRKELAAKDNAAALERIRSWY